MEQKTVHFSIDDIGGTLRHLTHTRPSSLFDLPLFKRLKSWNLKYGVKATMYCYALVEGDFLISEIPGCYAKDFTESEDWLKFGFHSKRDIPGKEETGYAAGFELIETTMSKLSAGTTDILRMHYYEATSEQKVFLREKGVKTLLYIDDDSIPYDENDIFMDCGLRHFRTRVQFEKIPSITPEALHIGRNNIAAFTHEWCFDENADKIEHGFEIYHEEGYVFVG